MTKCDDDPSWDHRPEDVQCVQSVSRTEDVVAGDGADSGSYDWVGFEGEAKNG